MLKPRREWKGYIYIYKAISHSTHTYMFGSANDLKNPQDDLRTILFPYFPVEVPLNILKN